ncbi:CapA family protein [Lederbergia sp. NSJ-179]|uniref:CapA family protein n=1 Tax=Lederbergia sp. NSJ-179 TaxID=2931402 RepID=UPI001FD4C1CA|nr:CapA family protein [Lederbergia sp. NSJ-179]MCJ7841254.1 CapA family protein [Lederbergia sp. NSJ-179]
MKNKISFITISILSLLIFVSIGLLIYKNSTSSAYKMTWHSQSTFAHEAKQYETEAVIAGIGDILIHDRVYNDAKTNNGYNFEPILKPVYSLLQKPDFLIANQESIPGGSALGLSSYPSFNSPHEIIDALMEAGVDMVTTANNHMLDKGEKGILSAIDYYEQKKLPYTGTFKSPEDKKTIRIMNVKGIQIAVLAYSYGTNGVPIPEGKDYLVSLIDPKQMEKDIKEAKEKADIVLLALHWGKEYEREPNQTQKQLAHQMMEAGADIIFGSHPHVLQPIEWIDKADGTKGVVIYSLGNFLSGQNTENVYKDLGGMFEVTLKKKGSDSKSNTTIENIDFHPTFNASKQASTYRVYPLDNANEKGLTNRTGNEIKQFMLPK